MPEAEEEGGSVYEIYPASLGNANLGNRDGAAGAGPNLRLDYGRLGPQPGAGRGRGGARERAPRQAIARGGGGGAVGPQVAGGAAEAGDVVELVFGDGQVDGRLIRVRWG